MGMYGIATRPLINELPNVVNKKDCKQVWYADDSTACGKLRGKEMDPLATKTILIAKPKKGLLKKYVIKEG